MPQAPSGPPSGSANASNEGPAQEQGIQHNQHHNAPPPQSHKDDCAKHDMNYNDKHTNQGPGHH